MELVKWIAGYHEALGALQHHGSQGAIELFGAAHRHNCERHAQARTSSAVSRLEALSGFHSKATRERAGTAALNSCSRLGCTSGPRGVLPVMLPPGWGADALVQACQARTCAFGDRPSC